MIRLNLGCGTPGTPSWHPQPGYVNLDKSTGWSFEDGLPNHEDGSVEAITISHASMYLPIDRWPAFMAECARVLCDGGVIRITEDNTADTRSRTYPNGWRGSQPVVTLTNPEMVKAHFLAAGLVPHDCDAVTTNFRDSSIMQDQHGGEPHCFFVEGIRMTRVFFEPHADDGALFGAFIIMRYRPRIVTCFGSAGDYGDTSMRETETKEAMGILGGGPCIQWRSEKFGDVESRMREVDEYEKPSLVFAPHPLSSHPDHVTVALAARAVFGDRLRTYHTYDEAGKVRSEWPVAYEPAWIQSKLRALTRYPSQNSHARAHRFFMWDHFEYWGDGAPHV